MKNNDWHEQIQRYVSGQSSADEAAALQQALNDDAELRDLYLDYVNLDLALGAAAERAEILGTDRSAVATFPSAPLWRSPEVWRWFGAAAALVAAAAFLSLRGHGDPAPARPDVAAAIASTQSAIARLSFQPTDSAALVMSPTASLLDQPGVPQ